ncbi:MAG: class I SAM-dependent methyltransferase [Promethearchaeota archaeon]
MLEKAVTPDIFGLILKEQLVSKEPIFHLIEREDGYITCNNTQKYFATKEDWPDNELALLQQAESPVLDIGCGAGRHALYLQEKGIDVIGLDISEGAVYVCNKRGLKKVVQGSAAHLPSFKKPFNTFLLLFNNFGILGNQPNTLRLLKNLHQLGTPDANILLSYANVEQTDDPFHLAIHKHNLAAGRLKGEIILRFRFLGYFGSWFGLWLPTNDQFQETIQQADWTISKDFDKEGFHHVMLTKAEL